jgi:hypothetical protein
MTAFSGSDRFLSKVLAKSTAKLSTGFAALVGSTAVGICTLGVSLPAEAAMVANYQFQNTLSSAVPTAPNLVPFALGTYTLDNIGGTPT